MIKESEAPETLTLSVESDINNDLNKHINYYREDLITNYWHEIGKLTADMLRKAEQ